MTRRLEGLLNWGIAEAQCLHPLAREPIAAFPFALALLPYRLC
jgi:hypothetical protein